MFKITFQNVKWETSYKIQVWYYEMRIPIVYSIYGSYRCHLEVAPVGILDSACQKACPMLPQDSMKLAGTISMGLSLHMSQCIGQQPLLPMFGRPGGLQDKALLTVYI